jgi:hypothetical protein
MRGTLIIIFLLVGNTSFSQRDSLISDFLASIIERETDTSIIAYTKTIGYDYYAYIPTFFLSKGRVWDRETRRYVLRLSRKERRSIDEEVSKQRSSVWSDSLFPQSDLITPRSSEVYIRSYPSRHIYQFTSPIFFRNNSLALILIKHHYPGNQKGYEETVFYRKQGAVWCRIALIKRDEWGF